MPEDKSFVTVNDKTVDANDGSVKDFEFPDFQLKDFSAEDLQRAGVAPPQGLTPSALDAIEKRVKRKVDIRLLACLWCIVFLDGLDLGALSLAKVNGIQKSLNMSSVQFSTALSVASVGGIVMQIPSNMFLTHVRPSLYLPGAAVIFGLITLFTGFLQNASALIALRFFLGCVEAAFVPGSLLLVSSWYKRDEIGIRGAVVLSAVQLSSALGGLFGAVVQKLEGVHGLEAWRWMFIIEGTATTGVALIAFFVLPDYPRNTRWLTPLERAVAVWRLKKDAGGMEEDDDMPMITGLKLALKDWHVYLFAFMAFSIVVTNSATSFLATIVATLGFNTVITDLLTVPPSIIAIFVSLANNWSADRTGNASFHVMWPSVVAVVGFVLIATASTTGVRYFAMILIIGFGGAGVYQAWVQKTILRPRAKRASSVALVGTVANIAQIWTSYMYNDKDSPHYVLAMLVNTIFALMVVSSAVVMRIMLLRANKKMEGKEADIDGGRRGKFDPLQKGFRFVT